MKHFFTIILILAVSTYSHSQCDSIVCNVQINVSFDHNGEAEIFPDMILQGFIDSSCVYEVQLLDGPSGNVIEAGPSLTLDCTHLGDQYIRIEETQSNNFCLSTISLEDKTGVCPYNLVIYDNSTGCDSYEFILNGAQNFSGDCVYLLDQADLQPTNSFELTNVNPSLSGISTLDLLIMQEGLLFGFESALAAVLSDVNMDGAAGTDDLILLRRVILGIDLPQDVIGFALIRNDFQFPSDFDPFDFDLDFTTIEFTDVELSEQALILQTYNLGDMNDSGFQSDDLVNRSAVNLRYDDFYFNSGEEKTITFSLDSEVRGFTGNINFGDFEILEVSPVVAPSNWMLHVRDNIALSFLNTDAITVSFELSVRATREGLLSDQINLVSGKLNEAVTHDLVELDVHLQGQLVDNEELLNEHAIYIFPNPVSDFLNIDLGVSELSDVEISIFNLVGSKILNEQLNTQQVKINLSTISRGSYLLKVDAQHKKIVTKLIKL